jgi:hypothetical protein
MDAHELRPGLWRWTARHSEWDDQIVSSAYLEAPGAVVLVDPLVPTGEEERFFAALDADVARSYLDVAVVLTNPWHRRSAPDLSQRYDARIFVGFEGPLPGGLEAYAGGMQPDDVVLHAPSHRVLFTGDTLVGNELCPEDWLAEGRDHHVACLRQLLQLDADLVVPSHGEPFAISELAALLHSPPSAA